MVISGLQRLLDDETALVRGRRVGLLCNATAVDARLRHASQIVGEAGCELAALFGPEHGVSGAAQDMVGVASSDRAGRSVPVYSLYGDGAESLAPEPEWLEGLDCVLVDMQDIGSRYYTYIWTLLAMMRGCAEQGVQVIVLDRPNPLGGQRVEGPGIEPGFESFVGRHSLAVRHGLTIGELARKLRADLELDLELNVVGLRGWRRAMLFDETGLPWVMPSPNMPTLDTALVYPGGCLLEGTQLSEGRGTTRPFELLGAPWVDGERLARALADEDLPGVGFRPLTFEPTFHKHAGEPCGGVQLHVFDRHAFRPLRTGVAILCQLHRLWPEQFAWRTQPYEFVADRPAIDLLAGGRWLREGIDGGATLGELCGSWPRAEARFRESCAPHLLYRA